MNSTGRRTFRPVLVAAVCLTVQVAVPAGCRPPGAGDTATPVRGLDRAAGIAAPACTGCRDGDLLADAGDRALVIGVTSRPHRSFYGHPTADAMGSILSFAPRPDPGATVRSDLMIGSPYVRRDDRTVYIVYEAVESVPPAGGAAGASFVARAALRTPAGPTANIVTTYSLRPDGGALDIDSLVTNSGPGPLGDLRYALHMDAGQIYEFSPVDPQSRPSFRVRVFPKPGHLLGWIDWNSGPPVDSPRFIWDGAAILEDPRPVELAPGESHRVRYTLIAASRPGDLLRTIFDRLEIPAHPASIVLESGAPGPFEIVVEDAGSRAVVFRSFVDGAGPVDLRLPAGRYVVRAHFFPGVVEASLLAPGGAGQQLMLRDPPAGVARVRIRDRAGAFVPGKVTFTGRGPTRTPYFRPHDPVRSGRYWESFKNSCFPSPAGTDIGLPAGTYVATASRGPAYTIDRRTIEVRAGARLAIDFTLDRAVDTSGLLSVDPHLHTLESDGAVTVEERVRSLVAEGVDVAIATDHNRLTDYRPALRAIGLAGELETIVGDEVTVPDLMDFNTYPVTPRAGMPDGCPLDPRFEGAGPAFGAARDRDPGVVVQVNHPRGWDYDFFNVHDLEAGTAATARPGFDTTFDLLEAINGPRLDAEGNAAAVRDWMNLLNRGVFRPIVGSSDAHEIDRDEPGYSRTWVESDRPATGAFDGTALVEAMRRGRSFVSNGPIVQVSLDGSAGPGDLHPAARGRARLAVRVRTAPWVAADSVELIVNGTVRDTWPIVPAARPATGWRREADLRFEHDAWIVVIVRGRRGLDPVVQARPSAAGPGGPVLPFAITNPIFVDADVDGRFDPPLPGPIGLRPR
jgi:hypothetical protein